MSIQALSWVLEKAPIPNPTPPGIPSAQALTLVLIALANVAGRDGEDAFPSVSTIARATRLSERQVQRCLAALLDFELIELGDQRIVEAKIYRADLRPTCYNLRMDREDAVIHRGDTMPPRSRNVQVKRSDTLSPRTERGDTQALNEVTFESERGDTLSPEPKYLNQEINQQAAHASEAAPAEPAPRSGDMLAEIAASTEPRLAELESASRHAGLSARFDGLSVVQRATVDCLIDVHGIAALVAEARRVHRPADPARYASAWIKLWQAMPAPTPAAAPLCGYCDHGFLDEDANGRAVKCPCRSRHAAPVGAAR